MKEILNFLLTKLVNHPDKLNIETEELDGITRFGVTLDEEDYSVVIGKQGATIKAIQDILVAYSRVHNVESAQKIYINIV